MAGNAQHEKSLRFQGHNPNTAPQLVGLFHCRQVCDCCVDISSPLPQGRYVLRKDVYDALELRESGRSHEGVGFIMAGKLPYDTF
jgi:hypothetical protein